MDREAKLAAALAALSLMLYLARSINRRRPPHLDRLIRRYAQSPALDVVADLVAPLYPMGLPPVLIPAATLLVIWLRRRNARGWRQIESAAMLGWMAHRAVKLFYHRERPRALWRSRRRGKRKGNDAYPSGHTTGVTMVAMTVAQMLRRNKLLPKKAALAIGIGLPIAMGINRVLSDEHWASDVLGGWLTGGGGALALDALFSEGASVSSRRRPTAPVRYRASARDTTPPARRGVTTSRRS